MKKVSLMVVGAAAALGMLFTSCSKDVVAPEISTVTVNTTAITADGVTAEVSGTADLIGWAIKKGDKDFKSLVIRQGAGTDLVTITNADSIAMGTKVITGLTAGEYAIVVTDKDDNKATRTFKLTVVAVATPLNPVHTGIVLGNANADAGSYYSIESGVLKSADAKANPTKVDFVYNGEVISPNAATLTEVKNANKVTKFQTVTGVDFDKATTADLAKITPAETKATATEGAVIAFLTQDGTKGLLKITKKTSTGTGDATISTITISVKK